MTQSVNITPEQIQKAAQAGVNLLSDDERVSVPPSMALNGDLSVLNAVLVALANGQAIVTAPQEAPDVDLPDVEGGPEEGTEQ